MDHDALLAKITAAADHFIFSNRFYYELLLRTNKRISANVHNVAAEVSGRAITLTFQPEFVEEQGENEIARMMEHEILHIVLKHQIRGKPLDKEVFAIAADIAVDQIMSPRNEAAERLKKVLGTPAIQTEREAEYYYRELMNSGNLKDTKEQFVTADDHSQWNNEQEQEEAGSSEEREAEEKESGEHGAEKSQTPEMMIDRTVQDALQSAHNQLNNTLLASYIDRLYRGDAARTTAWQKILHNYITRVLYRESSRDYTLKPSKKRPDKKRGYPYPSLKVDPKPELRVAVIIDSSGSVTDGKLASVTGDTPTDYTMKFELFMKEIQNIAGRDIRTDLIIADEHPLAPLQTANYMVREELLPLRESIVSLAARLGFDENGTLRYYRKQKHAELLKLLAMIVEFNAKVDGYGIPGIGGGTSYREAVQLAGSLRPKPDCILYFTDTHDDGTLGNPGIPLLFAVTERNRAPYKWAAYLYINDIAGK